MLTTPACLGNASPGTTLGEGIESESERVLRRIRTTLASPAVAVYDTMLIHRFKLLALSDDPDICKRLVRGAGLHGSTTVFALMGGKDGTHYVAQPELEAVLQAGLLGGQPGSAIITAQLLDDTCQFVTAPGRKQVEAVASQGEVQPDQRGKAMSWHLALTLEVDAAPDEAEHSASPCPGLLSALMGRMQPSDASAGQAVALTCEAE